MGQIGSGVRDSVSFLQKYPSGSVLRCPTGAENDGGYDQRGLTSLRLRRITSSPSQTLRRLVRTTDDGRCGECSTLAAVRRGFVFHTSRIVRLTTLYRPVCSKARYSSRIAFFAYPTCIRHPRWGGEVPSEYCHPGWYGKTRMVWLPDGEKIRRYVYSFWHDPRTWQTDGRTDGRTDRQTPHDGIGRAYA